MLRTRFERTARGLEPDVRQIYPTPSGGDIGQDSTKGGMVPAEDSEPRAIRCFQCGQPIEDYAEIENCPFCGSDNMLGAIT